MSGPNDFEYYPSSNWGDCPVDGFDCPDDSDSSDNNDKEEKE